MQLSCALFACCQAPALNGYMSNSDIVLSDAFTKKCHVPWTFTYRFMVYEYVSIENSHGSITVIRVREMVPMQMAQQVQSPALGTWFECTCTSSLNLYISPLCFSSHSWRWHPSSIQDIYSAVTRWEGWNIRKWQPDPPKSRINIFFLAVSLFVTPLLRDIYRQNDRTEAIRQIMVCCFEAGSITAGTQDGPRHMRHNVAFERWHL